MEGSDDLLDRFAMSGVYWKKLRGSSRSEPDRRQWGAVGVRRKNRSKTRKRVNWLFAMIVLCGVALIIFFRLWPAQVETPDVVGGQTDGATQTEEVNIDPLTGRQVQEVVPLLAVMVDNLSQSRPQTGLGEAGVVYEIEAEGAISRFFALYAGDPPANVGPVRSARTYFLHLVREWGAYYAHIGGSNDALANIYRWGIEDFDEFKNSPGFWRDKSRRAPHNTYLDVAKALAGKKDTGRFKGWVFTDPPEDVPDLEEISFRYTRDYLVSYRYSSEQKAYLRLINGIPHKDRITGRQISVTNVVIQYAPHLYLSDELGHIDVNLIGQGKAEFFLAGKYRTGTWEKANALAPTKFYGSDGQEISFVRGNTWIHVLRPEAVVNRS